ncbi:MAG TPA: TRAP transporter small permease [Geminicoccaceae bacterium]|jgi:TRAP-type C4-dicarboxylate transport system permease small subunit|nr:TRAP transporter small permease [Geminicoccaceae bacterium]
MRAAHAIGRKLRPWLDGLYDLCGGLAALFLIVLLLVIVLQMAARWTGQQFPGSTDYAGYCMAAASFLALAHTLNRGAHIRVSLLLARLGRWRRLGELWCFGVGAALGCYFAFYAIKAVWVSYKLNDISQGQDATPLWIPQLAMALGTTLLAVALLDRLLQIACGGSWALGEGAPRDESADG